MRSSVGVAVPEGGWHEDKTFIIQDPSVEVFSSLGLSFLSYKIRESTVYSLRFLLVLSILRFWARAQNGLPQYPPASSHSTKAWR